MYCSQRTWYPNLYVFVVVVSSLSFPSLWFAHSKSHHKMHHTRRASASTAVSPKSMAPLPQDVSFGAPASDELVPITCATTGPQVDSRHTSAAAVTCMARGIVGLPVIKKPWLSKLFGKVCQPDTTVLVVANPRSSQPVISSPLAEGGEDGKDGDECVDVGRG